jgi:hypothetical protein
MTRTETKLGLTPITKRLAYYFVCCGVGTYEMVDHPHYDEAKVEELYPWNPNPQNKDEYGAGLRVTFFKDGERIRYVEFNIRCVGGGGKEAIRRIK